MNHVRADESNRASVDEAYSEIHENNDNVEWVGFLVNDKSFRLKVDR